MDFEEEEEREEQEEEIEVTPGERGYDIVTSGRKMGPTMGSGELLLPVTAAIAATPTATNSSSRKGGVRYRECQKNHAVGIGGHAVDGCGEFMAAGEEGTLDALKCAACTCHRNFHRKEAPTSHHHHPPPPPQLISSYYHPPQPHQSGYLHLTPAPPLRPLALPATSGGGYSREDVDDASNPSSSGGGGGGSSRKRFRTKFTQEQRERMLAFAEQLGWRIQKHDDAAVEAFCADAGIKRHVLKVWMHNNKHTLGKKP